MHSSLRCIAAIVIMHALRSCVWPPRTQPLTSSILAAQLLAGLSKARDSVKKASDHIIDAAESVGCGRKMVQIIVERIAQVGTL